MLNFHTAGEIEEEVEVLLEDTLAKKNKTPTPLPVETPFEEEKPAETPDKPAEVTPAPEEISTPAPVTETASQDGVPETIPEESPQSPSPVPGWFSCHFPSITVNCSWSV